MANSNSLKHASDQNHESYADDAKARRVLNVLDDGTPVDAANPLPISLSSDIEIGAVEIKDGTTDERANVDWDGFYSALAVTDGRMVFNVDDNDIAPNQIPQTTNDLNYGFNDVANYWTRFLTQEDNDAVPDGQVPQLVLPLNYYWEAKSNAWKRWQGDSGSMWTTVVGMYTPTFDSVMDDVKDAVKIIGQETPTDDYVTPTKGIDVISANMVYDGTTWDMMRGDSVNGTLVNLGSNNDVTVTGTVSVSNMIPAVETGLATSALQLPNDHDVTVSNMIPAVETGLATSALQLPDDHNVTANAGTNLNTSALALQTSQGQWRGITSGLLDWKEADGKPRVSTTPYLYDIGEGNISGHMCWEKIGYNPVVTNVEEEVWSYGGKYAFSKGEALLEVVSSDNTQDIGSNIHSGTSTGGSTTTLVDTGADFTAGTPVAVYDCVILDKSGASPEYGFVTAVTDANTLTIAGGFSNGGSGDARDYIVVDRSAHTGAHAVLISYLDEDYVQHKEIVITNGTTEVRTINADYYRVNDMFVIAAGSLEHCLGNISLRDLANTPIYSYITAGYTRARSAVFTVKDGITLYITSMNMSWSSPNDSKVQSARMILRANMLPSGFQTGLIFYSLAEVMVTNQDVQVKFDCPLKIETGTDFVVSCISMNAAGTGPANVILRGWTE
jgi:hypothetical protein